MPAKRLIGIPRTYGEWAFRLNEQRIYLAKIRRSERTYDFSPRLQGIVVHVTHVKHVAVQIIKLIKRRVHRHGAPKRIGRNMIRHSFKIVAVEQRGLRSPVLLAQIAPYSVRRVAVQVVRIGRDAIMLRKIVRIFGANAGDIHSVAIHQTHSRSALDAAVHLILVERMAWPEQIRQRRLRIPRTLDAGQGSAVVHQGGTERALPPKAGAVVERNGISCIVNQAGIA